MSNEKKLTVVKAIVLVVLGITIPHVIGFILGIVYVIVNPISSQEEFTNFVNSSYFVQVLLIVIAQSTFLIMALVINKKYEKKIAINNEFNFKNLNLTLLLSITIFTVCFISISSEIESLIASIIGRIELFSQSLNALAKMPNAGGLIVALVTIGLLPAVIEELFFRGLIQKKLSINIGSNKAIIITSILFSLIHINPTVLVSIFLLSLFMGYIYKKTDKLIYPVLIHFINNCIAVLLTRYDFYEMESITYSVEGIEHISLLVLIPSFIIGSLMLFIIYKNRPLKKSVVAESSI